MSKELLYVIQANKCDKKEIIHILKTHPEIKFVSMVGIDLAGNDTDEKILSAFSSKTSTIFIRVMQCRQTDLPWY